MDSTVCDVNRQSCCNIDIYFSSSGSSDCVCGLSIAMVFQDCGSMGKYHSQCLASKRVSTDFDPWVLLRYSRIDFDAEKARE